MIPFETLLTFFGASLALALAPGPDNLFVLAQSALHGKAAGLFVTLGLCTGLLFHTAVVSLGIAVIFQNSALAFNLLKGLGAIYLLYLAWQTFRAVPSGIGSGGQPNISRRRLYFRGVIMNITNPKVAIFFLAFLPQFADPAGGSLTLQLLLLGWVFMVATILVFGSVALGAGFLWQKLKNSPTAQRVMNRIAATVFVALAIRLATAAR